MIEPKSRLNLQAADWETILVRRAVIIALLIAVVLLGLLLIVWQVDTRVETKIEYI